jgi:hypothetical protein
MESRSVNASALVLRSLSLEFPVMMFLDQIWQLGCNKIIAYSPPRSTVVGAHNCGWPSPKYYPSLVCIHTK